MTWLWALFAALVALAGLRYYAGRHAASGGPPRIDDDALRQIVDTGRLSAEEEDEPLDLDEAARAEEEFWDEPWDEPEEFRR